MYKDGPTSCGRVRRSFWTKFFQFIPYSRRRNFLGSIKQTTLYNQSHYTRELTSQWSKCKHVAKDAARSRRSVGKCAVPAAAAAVPRGMRRRVIYDPPAAPSPLTPLDRQRRVLDVGTNRCEETRQVYGQRFEGVVRCVMQACVLCARWTCNDGR